MGEMKAIQTEYKGYLFRSRLEARWAVFFDACGVDWEYEPEGYDLGNGIHYLPDFLLKRVQLGGYGSGSEFSEIRSLYVEVKGQMTQADSEKILAFYKAGLADGLPAISDTPVLVLGDIPPGTTLDRMRSWVDAESGRPFPWGARAFHSGTVEKIRVNTYYLPQEEKVRICTHYDRGLCDTLEEYEKLPIEYIEEQAYGSWMDGAR